MKEDRLMIIDANSVIHRAFHALPSLTDSKRNPAGAVYGTLLAFFSILSEFSPRYVVAVFDFPGKTFRHEKYKEYKATRPKTPEDLVFQIKETKRVFSLLGICVLEKEGWEADDIAGTLSSSFSSDTEIIIVSGDRDILQLAREEIKVYNLKRGVKKGVLYDRDDVQSEYRGVPPERIPDVKALQGDPSDNIPGVRGVGEKTALSLISDFGDLENLYVSLDKVSGKLKEKLLADKDKAFMSKDLAMIRKDVPFSLKLDDLRFHYNREKTIEILEELGFKSLTDRLPREEEKNNLRLAI